MGHPHFGIVLALNLPWLLLPVAVLVRVALAPPPLHPGAGGLPAAGDAPGTLPAERVVGVALASLGREPAVVPGRVNALAVLLGRLAPREVTIAVTAAGELGLGSTPAAAAPAGTDAC